ncbi:Hypothetical protein FKW44_018516 [Caligus rogercresseyi]|uniref:Uncharacterized protein n=1 Tax=Caligus rogercresseyi TaxID=217165 RepID=A0A7T8GUI2_CALRO|nr:Hypothetical protein FKW44_018516 [Caligus rogercresseyi]
MMIGSSARAATSASINCQFALTLLVSLFCIRDGRVDKMSHPVELICEDDLSIDVRY